MDIIESKMVTTRKPHKCWGCRREFPAGEKMKFVKCIDGGQITNVHWCEVCEKVTKNYDPDGDGMIYGELIDDCEHWEEIRAEIEGVKS